MLVLEFVIFIITSSLAVFPALSDTVYISFFVPFVLCLRISLAPFCNAPFLTGAVFLKYSVKNLRICATYYKKKRQYTYGRFPVSLTPRQFGFPIFKFGLIR